MFGIEWAAVYLIPPVVDLCAHQNYLYRMTAISAVAQLFAVVPRDHALRARMVPALVAGVNDPVPNCRFNACKAIALACKAIDSPTLESTVLPALSAMSSDEDPDVKYFASKALQGCMEVGG